MSYEFKTQTLEGTKVVVIFNTGPDGIEVTSITDEFDTNLMWKMDKLELKDIYQQCRDLLKREREEALDLKYWRQSTNE